MAKKQTLYEQLVEKHYELKELEKEVTGLRAKVRARAEKQKVAEFHTGSHIIAVGDRVTASINPIDLHHKLHTIGYGEEEFFGLVKVKAQDAKTFLGEDHFEEIADYNINPYSIIRITKK